MRTNISIFIAAIALLLDVTTVKAQSTNAYFKKNGVTVFQTPIADIDSIVFMQTPEYNTCESFDNPQGVVINGVRWATRNVGDPGTFASSPCDYGEYYQFNKGTTDFLFYDDYYNSVYDQSDSWLPANDPSPAGWRVPTLAEIQKLFDTNYVTYEWTAINGINGVKFTDRTTGNSIFLPTAGFRDYDGTFCFVGSYGNYWSSTVNNDFYAFYLFFFSGKASWSSLNPRGIGISVRPVAK